MIVEILASLAFVVQTAPTPSKAHELHYVKRGNLKLPFYYLKATTKDYPAPNLSFASLAETDAIDLAVKTITSEVSGLTAADIQVKNSYRDSAGVMHVYAKRVLDGITVDQ